MSIVTAFVKHHPLVVFFILAYTLTWPLIPLVSVSPLWGFPALFGPALAAVILATVADGRPGLKDLLGRMVRWRVGARWYAVALGLPMVLALTTAGLHLLLSAQTSVDFGGLSVLNFVVFVLIVGEELGWRGYALPRLLAERSALAASLILGALWGAWHLPTFFVPGAPQYGLPFSAFVLLTMAYSVIIGWVYVHARGSVLIVSLLHGSINLSQGFFLGGVDPAREYWLLAAVYGAAALAVALVFERTSRVSTTRERIVPGCKTRHRAVDCAADERQVVIPQLCCLVFCCSKWRIMSQARNRFAKEMATRNLCNLDTTLTPPGAQHGARQGKGIGVGMWDLQVRANPCNTHWLTRNEQDGGSSPLVGPSF